MRVKILFPSLLALAGIVFSSTAHSQPATPPAATSSDVISILFLCGLMGLVGQGARVVVGLKTLFDYKANASPDSRDIDLTLFSLARLIVSLIIGFLAGVVTGMVYWKLPGGLENIKVDDFDSMIKFSIAGYIGTDVIESFTAKYFEGQAAAPAQIQQANKSNDSSGGNGNGGAQAAQPPADLGPLMQKIDMIAGKVDDLRDNRASESSDAGPDENAVALISLASIVTHAKDPPLLGSLSAKYEVGGRGPGTVSSGIGDAGGASYGSYQMTSRPDGGTVKSFVAQLPADKKGPFDGHAPGDAGFTAAWKAWAQNDAAGFFSIQHQYIEITHYTPLCQSVLRIVDINSRSFALQNVVWSTAVQHGPKNGILALVLEHFDFANYRGTPHELDGLVIRGIYAERGRRLPDGRLAYFTKSSQAVQAGVAKRFINEQRDALQMLASESATGDVVAKADGYEV